MFLMQIMILWKIWHHQETLVYYVSPPLSSVSPPFKVFQTVPPHTSPSCPNPTDNSAKKYDLYKFPNNPT